VEKRNFHGFKPTGRDVEKIAESRGGSGAVDRDGIVVRPVVQEGVVRDGDALDAGNGAELIGELEPGDRQNRIVRDGVKDEKAIGGEAGGLVRQMLKSGDKEARDEKDETAKGDLGGDECVHEATARVRIFGSIGTAFEGIGGLQGGGAKSRDHAEEAGNGESESDAEQENAPVRGKSETNGIV